MNRNPQRQLDLPISGERPQKPTPAIDEPPTPEELEQLRRKLPENIRFGSSGWEYPGWSNLVWHTERSAADLARDGLIGYGAHPLLDSIAFEPGPEVHASERDLRRCAGQLPADLDCSMLVHSDITTPRFTHTSKERSAGRRTGSVNPNFLNSRFFINEVSRVYASAFGDRLGRFHFIFPPTLYRAGIEPKAFVERLDHFLGALPKEFAVAVEIRDPNYLSLSYARTLVKHSASHVFTTFADMPPLAMQARAVATSPELLIHVVDPTGDRTERAKTFSPFNRIQDADHAMRAQVVKLLEAKKNLPTNIIVQNEAEGSSPLTIVALTRALTA